MLDLGIPHSYKNPIHHCGSNPLRVLVEKPQAIWFYHCGLKKMHFCVISFFYHIIFKPQLSVVAVTNASLT